MKFGLDQQVRTDLQLRLSPQILQRIEVLQLSGLDLSQMIEQELQENEALEVDQELSDDVDPGEDSGEADDGVDVVTEALEQIYEDEDWSPGGTRTVDREAPSRTDAIEALASNPVSLVDHLKGQLDVMDIEPRRLAIATGLVDALDDRGWLPLPLDEVELELEPPPDLDEKEAALHVVQSLDPLGVGCRDMVECLLLQLEAIGAEPFLTTLVLDHLDDIAHNRVPRIVRETGQPVDRVLAGIEAISHLDPLPGRRFGLSGAPVVRPDVIVRRMGEDYEISLENDWVPPLTVSKACLQMASDRSTDPELRKHIRKKVEGAQAFIDAIEQRKHTLFRVASELVNRQSAFLERGRAHLRPLRMQEVADALGVHVSTVSRAISGKYMEGPRGLVPMRALFTGEVPVRTGAGGHAEEGASRTSVQEQIREIIAAEDPRHPLSDEAIVTRLKELHSLDIARRTVTKYRKAMKIGSSRARRVYGST